MKKFIWLSLGFLSFTFQLVALDALPDNFSKKIKSGSGLHMASVQSQIYLPSKEKRYSWSNSWVYAGGSDFTYTANGNPLTVTDTSIFFFNSFINRTAYTYDNLGRQTQILNQCYDEDSLNFLNCGRSVLLYDVQGEIKESRSDNWNAGVWSTVFGYQQVRTYNAQNKVTENIRNIWNQTSAVWETQVKTTYEYDAQSRLSMFTDMKWDVNQFVNEEKTTFQYSANNGPNQAVIQVWNGTAFVDSSRIIDLVWLDWTGSLETSSVLSYVLQNKVGATWVNDSKVTNVIGMNASKIELTEKFVNGLWQNDSRRSDLYDAYSNIIFGISEKYDPVLAKWDTMPMNSNKYQRSYDGSGRQLEQIRTDFTNLAGLDQPPIYGWRKVQKKVFSQHQVFTNIKSVESGGLRLLPNPVVSGGSFRAESNGVLFVLDITGRKILSRYITDKEDISTAGIKPGIYQVIIEESSGKISRQKLHIF
jgi:hypothetical protein